MLLFRNQETNFTEFTTLITTAPRYYYNSFTATSLYTLVADLESFFQIFFKGKNGEPIGRGQLKPETLKLMRDANGVMMGEAIYGLGAMLYIDMESNEYILVMTEKARFPLIKP